MKYFLLIFLLYGNVGKSQENESVNTNLTFFEGENAILPCPFDAINSFWEKDNIVINDNNYTYSESYRIIQIESHVGHSLEIINITTNDSGLFRCTRNNDLNIPYRIRLLVTSLSFIYYIDYNQTYSERYRIIQNESHVGHALEIINITTIDSGWFRCTRNSDLIAHVIRLLVKKTAKPNETYESTQSFENLTVEKAVTPIEDKKDTMLFVIVGLLGSLSGFLILALVFMTWFFTKRSGNRHSFQPRSQDIPPESQYYEIDNVQLQDLNIRPPIQEVPMDNRFSYEHPYQPLSNDRPSDYQDTYQPFQQTRHYEQIEGDNMQTRSDEDNRASYVSINQPHSEDKPSQYQDRCQNFQQARDYETIEQDDTNVQPFIDTGYTDALSKPCKL